MPGKVCKVCGNNQPVTDPTPSPVRHKENDAAAPKFEPNGPEEILQIKEKVLTEDAQIEEKVCNPREKKSILGKRPSPEHEPEFAVPPPPKVPSVPSSNGEFLAPSADRKSAQPPKVALVSSKDSVEGSHLEVATP